MDQDEAFGELEAAIADWYAGDTDSLIEHAGNFNAWLMDEGGEPLTVDDWSDYIDDMNAFSDWIDSLPHEDREAFFGY